MKIQTIKVIFMMFAVAMSALIGCTTNKRQTSDSSSDKPKYLVCSFSATGTTAKAAQRRADLTGGELFEIKPAELYTEADLDWRDTLSRSYVEMHNLSYRPSLADSVPDMTNYDIVFIGYPNWWNTHPTVINTFIETANLKGKTIAPFMTSGGSNITNSEERLREQYPGLTFSKGLLMNDVDDREVKEWVDNL